MNKVNKNKILIFIKYLFSSVLFFISLSGIIFVVLNKSSFVLFNQEELSFKILIISFLILLIPFFFYRKNKNIIICFLSVLFLTLIIFLTSIYSGNIKLSNEGYCNKIGGLWSSEYYGMHPPGPQYCILPTSDSGKECYDDSECEGYCEVKYENSYAGRCYPYKAERYECGGYYYFKEGKVKYQNLNCWS